MKLAGVFVVLFIGLLDLLSIKTGVFASKRGGDDNSQWTKAISECIPGVSMLFPVVENVSLPRKLKVKIASCFYILNFLSKLSQ